MTTQQVCRGVFAAAVAFMVSGCGDGETEAPQRRAVVKVGGGEASKADSAATSTDATAAETPAAAGDQAWGTIKGRIIWGPAALPAAAFEDAQKDTQHCLAKGKIPKEEVVVDPASRGVAHIIAYLKNGEDLAIHSEVPQDAAAVKAAFLKQFEADNGVKFDELQQKVASEADMAKRVAFMRGLKAPVIIDQLYCRYVPHAMAVRDGTPTIVLNGEPISHNVKINDPNGKNEDNQNMPPGTMVVLNWSSGTFPMKIVCNVHGWMNMLAMTFDHPYFDVTKEDGTFEIKNVPAGEVELVLWGTKRLERGKKLTIKGGETVEVNVKYDFESNKPTYVGAP